MVLVFFTVFSMREYLVTEDKDFKRLSEADGDDPHEKYELFEDILHANLSYGLRWGITPFAVNGIA